MKPYKVALMELFVKQMVEARPYFSGFMTEGDGARDAFDNELDMLAERHADQMRALCRKYGLKP